MPERKPAWARVVGIALALAVALTLALLAPWAVSMLVAPRM